MELRAPAAILARLARKQVALRMPCPALGSNLRFSSGCAQNGKTPVATKAATSLLTIGTAGFCRTRSRPVFETFLGVHRSGRRKKKARSRIATPGPSYRDGRIRTGDPCNPIAVRYRAAPRPEGVEAKDSSVPSEARTALGVDPGPAARGITCRIRRMSTLLEPGECPRPRAEIGCNGTHIRSRTSRGPAPTERTTTRPERRPSSSDTAP